MTIGNVPLSAVSLCFNEALSSFLSMKATVNQAESIHSGFTFYYEKGADLDKCIYMYALLIYTLLLYHFWLVYLSVI